MKQLKLYIRAGLANFLAQIVFILLFYVYGQNTIPGDTLQWKLILFAIIAIPAVLWSGFFYLQDKYEPEPASYLFMALLSGAALSSLLAIPVAKEIFQIDMWFYNSVFTLAWGSLIVYGMLFSAVVYLIIKFGYYPKDEFDEPVDGIVYGAFIGSGYALVHSIAYLFSQTGFTLFDFAYVSSSNVLIYSSTGGLIGYYLGQAKFFEKGNLENSIVSILIGATIIGVYHFLKEYIFIAGFDSSHLISYIITLTFSFIIFTIVFVLMKKFLNSDFNYESVAKPSVEYVTLMIMLVTFSSGIALKINEEMPGHFSNEEAAVELKYSFRVEDVDKDELILKNLSATKGKLLFKRRYKLAGESPVFALFYVGKEDLLKCGAEITKNGIARSIDDDHQVSIFGLEEKISRSGYYYTNGKEKEFPKLIYGYEDIIVRDGNCYIFCYENSPERFKADYKVYEELLKTVKFTN